MFGHRHHQFAGEVTYVDHTTGAKVTKPIHNCCHCGAKWVTKPGSGKRRGFCRNCHGEVCSDACAPCIPFEKQVEAIERGIIIGNGFR